MKYYFLEFALPKNQKKVYIAIDNYEGIKMV